MLSTYSWKLLRLTYPLKFGRSFWIQMLMDVFGKKLTVVFLCSWITSFNGHIFKTLLCCRIMLNFPFQAIGAIKTAKPQTLLCAVGGARPLIHSEESKRFYPPNSSPAISCAWCHRFRCNPVGLWRRYRGRHSQNCLVYVFPYIFGDNIVWKMLWK